MDTAEKHIAPRYWAFYALVLGLAGFAVNYLKLEIFFNVDFLFGSVLSMLALLRFGPAAGVIAAAIAASRTYFLWNHPWAWVILCGEAVFLSCTYGRKSRNLVLLDAIYWSVIGAPLIWVLYHGVLSAPPQYTVLAILKHSVNGVMNALIATIIHILIQLKGGVTKKLLTFRQLVFAFLVSLVMVLALTDLIVDLRITMQDDQTEMVQDTEYLSQLTRGMVSQWLKEHLDSVETLARLVTAPEDKRPGVMQQHVETIRAASSAFERLGVMDRNAVTIAYSPRRIDGVSTLGWDFSDRPYMPLLKERKKPLVGDLVLGRMGKNPSPKLPLLVPVTVSGEYRGFCVGVVDFSRLREVLQTIVRKNGAQITLVDGNGRIVVSTRNDLKTMERFARPAGKAEKQFGHGIYQWVPQARPGSTAMERWRRSLLVKETALGPDSGWKIIIETPYLPLLTALTTETVIRLLVLSLLMVAFVALSNLLSKGFVYPLRRLQEETRALPQQLLGGGRPEQEWPSSRVAEIDGLITNFRQMAQALRTSFDEINTLNETLEQRIGERTAELSESEGRYRFLAENAGDLIFRYRVHPEEICLYMSRSCERIFGYTPEEHYADLELPFRIVHPDDRHVLEKVRSGREIPEGYVLRWMHKDGRVIWLDTRLSVIAAPDGSSIEIVGVSRDVSEQKRNEALAAELEAEKVRLRIMEREKKYLKEKEMLVKDLHDGLGGLVSNIVMLGQYALLQQQENGNEREMLEKMVELGTEGMAEIRSFMSSTENGESAWSDLLAEIKAYAAKVLEPHGIHLELIVELPDSPDFLGSFVYVNIVRIFREIITNAVDHASADSVRVVFRVTDTSFELSVEDNGRGFAPESMYQQGTSHIFQRAEQIGATLSLVSKEGAAVSLSMPVAPNPT